MRQRLFYGFLLLGSLLLTGACSKEEDYSARDKQIIEDYLAAKGLTATATPEGVYYLIENPGSSDHPSVFSTVKVHYKGYLTDGTVFDETTGTSRTFGLSQTITGWQIGIPKFGKGGKGKLFIPSDYGYGASSSDKIPANSVLVFDIVLSDFY
ncbi:MAG: FKBP-type peptidyl-prolyl cis-trans isomerase [Bacteroidales bacterium]|nr:FKBP-type peptidyl-prolyl cis-trans isomerase [Bacteroidales bacterium]